MTEYISSIIISIKLYFKIALRFILILFKKDKRLKEIYFNENQNIIFKDSLLIIKYSFKNSIYYKIGNKITVNENLLVLNVKNLSSEFSFITYGFFEKKEYLIKISPKKKFINSTFKTQFTEKKLEPKIVKPIKLTNSQLKINSELVKINNKEIMFTKNNIKLNTNTFNQNDYL